MISMIDLRRDYEAQAEELQAAVARVLAGGRYILGAEVEAFEAAFAAYCGSRHAVAVSSGTAALHLALRAVGIGPGDEVIVPAMTFVATAAAVIYCGARAVAVDIDPADWTMNPAALEAAVTERTRAVIPVHLHGQPADMDEIGRIAARHGLTVIEDAAQAHGSRWRGQRAGSLGRLGCFSFYPAKNLGAMGEGGAVTTDDPQLAERLRMLRDWGQQGRHHHVELGFNYRMDALQGAILGIKLKRLEGNNEIRRRLAARYLQGLKGLAIALPAQRPEALHSYHQFAVRLASRDALAAALGAQGIETAVHYPVPLHLQPAYLQVGVGPGSLPESERAAQEFLSLPIHPHLTEGEVERVCETIRRELP